MRAGKLKGLAVGDLRRLPGLSDVPAIAETVPNLEMSAWTGLFVPAKTPKEIVARLTKETEAFLNDPEVLKYFGEQYIVASYKDPDAFPVYIKEELDKWTNVVKTAGIKAEGN